MGAGSSVAPVAPRSAESLHSPTEPTSVPTCDGALERTPDYAPVEDEQLKRKVVENVYRSCAAQGSLLSEPDKQFLRQLTASTEAPSDDLEEDDRMDDTDIVPWQNDLTMTREEEEASVLLNATVRTTVQSLLDSAAAMIESQSIDQMTPVATWRLPGCIDTEIEAQDTSEDVESSPGAVKTPSTRKLLFSLPQDSGSRNVSPNRRKLSPFRRGRGKSPAAMDSTTPKSMVSNRSMNSIASEVWDAPSETLIFLDWDDTLCPTTSCTKYLTRWTTGAPQDVALLVHQATVVEFLKAAGALGRVVIVTMAQKAWVNTCIERLMPEMADVLKELKIEVVSARESLPQRLRRQAFSDDRDPSQYLKTKAMDRLIKQFYKNSTPASMAGKPRSWKNIVSVGDSCAERLALQDLVFRRMQRSGSGDWKECRCKTLLLLENPTLEQLSKELRTVTKLISVLVHHDGDIHVDVDADDLVGEM
jgi:hypothetical protein